MVLSKYNIIIHVGKKYSWSFMYMSMFKMPSNRLWCLKSHMCYDLQNSKSLLVHIFACYSFYPHSSVYFNSYPKQCELLFFFLSIKNVTQGNSVYKWSYHENLKSWSWPHIRGNSFVISLCPTANPMVCHFWRWLSKLWTRTRQPLTGLIWYRPFSCCLQAARASCVNFPSLFPLWWSL